MNLLHCRIQNASAESVRDREGRNRIGLYLAVFSSKIKSSNSDLNDLDFRVIMQKNIAELSRSMVMPSFRIPTVGIAGEVGWFNPHPSSCLQTLIFEWKSVLNFNPWAKFQTFRHLSPPVLLGQLQHCSYRFIFGEFWAGSHRVSVSHSSLDVLMIQKHVNWSTSFCL